MPYHSNSFNSYDVENMMKRSNPSLPHHWDMKLFHHLLGQDIKWIQLVHSIIKLADEDSHIPPMSHYWKNFQMNKTMTLSRRDVARMLANAFLCRFPHQLQNCINFNSLYSSKARYPDNKVEKLKCLMWYLECVTKTEELYGSVEYKKVRVTESTLQSELRKRQGYTLSTLHVFPLGKSLYDADNVPQVDFANKNVGGGVLSNGCLQEEIKFITCPELLLAKLFPGPMEDDEAIIVTGAYQYSTFSGYGATFRCQGSLPIPKPCGPVIAIDALDFSNKDGKSHLKISDQYRHEYVRRELLKAFAGFSGVGSEFQTIATGNWGGGNFRGDPKLKLKIQWLAASLAGKNLHYYSYLDKNLEQNAKAVAREWHNKTVGELYNHLKNGCVEPRKTNKQPVKRNIDDNLPEIEDSHNSLSRAQMDGKSSENTCIQKPESKSGWSFLSDLLCCLGKRKK